MWSNFKARQVVKIIHHQILYSQSSSQVLHQVNASDGVCFLAQFGGIFSTPTILPSDAYDLRLYYAKLKTP